jgi:4a-hydroxytetrahydrobiopterin dehydratase
MSQLPIERLDDEAITTALSGLDHWKRVGDAIETVRTFDSYVDALAWVTVVGMVGEAIDHHPDMAIAYKRVTVTSSTHSAGGITEKDLELAALIDGTRQGDS